MTKHHIRYSVLLGIALATLSACADAPVVQTLTPTESLIVEYGRNFGWPEVPAEDWIRLGEDACSMRGWERDHAIDIAQRFVNSHADAYREQPSDEVAHLVFVLTTQLCRDDLPPGATGPGAVHIEPDD